MMLEHINLANIEEILAAVRREIEDALVIIDAIRKERSYQDLETLF